MNKSESKYFNTAKLMDEAFIRLIDSKDFAYITVKEICEKAGVNRSTFYLHYESINDLLSESLEYVLKQFMAYMPEDTKGFLAKVNECSLEELYLITPKYLRPYLTYIKEHRRIFRCVLEHSSIFQLEAAYKYLYRYIFMPILDRFDIDEDKRNYIVRFYIGGLMGIVNEWVKNDCKDDIDHIVSVMQYCAKSL